jgi:hypothetical protein
VVLVATVVLALGFWWWKFMSADIPPRTKLLAQASAASPTTADSNAEFQKLKGQWQRPDGGYIIEIKSIAFNGSMDVAYLNPKSIHVAKAEVSRDGSATKVFIELRDVNYPGSTYTLTYDSARDQPQWNLLPGRRAAAIPVASHESNDADANSVQMKQR